MSSISRNARSRSPSSSGTANRERPTQWAFRIGECAHPACTTSRWHLPGAGTPIPVAGDWHLLVTHDLDSTLTTSEQWVTDDPAGQLWVKIDGNMIELNAGNTAAIIRSDQHTPATERASLAGGVGFFSEVARLSCWLAHVDEHERRRRIAQCVGPEAYPVVLSTPESRQLAADHIHQQIESEWGVIESPQVIGYLSALTAEAPQEIEDRLAWFAAFAVCDPSTLPADQARLCFLLSTRSEEPLTPSQALVACCLRVLSGDFVDPAIVDRAEFLLGE
jgi:hypothetical protein